MNVTEILFFNAYSFKRGYNIPFIANTRKGLDMP